MKTVVKSAAWRAVGPKRRLFAALGALICAIALTGCGTAAGAGGSDEVTTIRYQSYAGTVDPLQLADALGYLPGLTLKRVGDVTGGPQSVQNLGSRQVDISSNCFYGALAQIVSTGAPIKAVVSTYGSSPKISSAVVTLEDSPIRSARDLIGKKISVNTLGANAEAVLDTWFAKSGLTKAEIKKITLVPLPPLNSIQSLEAGQLDAAYIGSGQLQASIATGVKLRAIVKDTDVVGSYSGGGFAMTDEFLKRNPTTSTTLVTGVAKAVRYIESHDRAEVLKIYEPWLRENGQESYIKAVQQNWAGTTGVADTDGASIAPKDIELWLGWLSDRGDVERDSIKPTDVFTNRYNKLAKESS